MRIEWLYLIVVNFIAISVSLFEVWGIAHYRVGWGEPLPQDKAWAKPLMRKAPFNLVGFQLLSRYHFFMYFLIVPAMVLLLGLAFRNWAAHPYTNWFGWLMWLIAGTMGVMALEDFLFFVFSTILGTPYPDALARLFRGEATWHPGQIDFGLFKLPAIYIWIPPVAALLLWLGSRFGGR